jgi:succinate dehydrogenase/fumarate reductase flavoprotein subunit
MSDSKPTGAASAAPTPQRVDLVVIGSGAGGLSAAVTAARLGLKVLLLEKEPVLGGTTAWSGGWMWIPRNALARNAGIDEHISSPRNYLKFELAEKYDDERVESFLYHAPRMVDFFRHNTEVQFIDGNLVPDFHGHNPHAAKGGRSVCAAPFDGRELGEHIKDLRAPLDMTTLWGMGIAAGADLRHFMQSMRSLTSLVYVTKRVLRHWWDLATERRGMQLVAGNALAARLFKSAIDAGVQWRTGVNVQRLLQNNEGRVCGVELAGGEVIEASAGVVLACGGCPHDSARQMKMLPYAKAAVEQFGAPHFSAAPKSNTGDGLRLAESVGAVVDADMQSTMANAPVSLAPRSDGTVCHFPHLIERGKPGLIAVTKRGQRFTNEGNSYNDFMQGLFKATPAGELPTAWLIVDRAFLRRNGLGAVKPAPMPWPLWTWYVGGWLRNGYLKRGRSIAELARACGIAADSLQATVDEYNHQARLGYDPQFQRGDTPYNRVAGDATYRNEKSLFGNKDCWPNPAVGPIECGPFYAVQVVPGSLGSFAGIKVNANAQALNAQGQPIAGLYMSGNDMASMMGGRYPSGGITLGPAMTFGYVAAHHAAGRLFPHRSTVLTPTDDQEDHTMRNQMYYELATMTLPFGTAGQAANNVKAFSEASEAKGELLGCWFTDIGVLNQMIVLRGFKTLDDLRAERERTQQHVSPFGCGDIFQSLEQHSYQGFPWMKPVRPSSESGISGPVYEIRTYGIKPGGVQGTIDLWEQYVPPREKLSPCVVAMVALDGPLRFTNIWAYESLNARSQIRADSVAQGIWPPKGGPALLTTNMLSTIAMPTAVSPLK